jgi:hypothetical protein
MNLPETNRSLACPTETALRCVVSAGAKSPEDRGGALRWQRSMRCLRHQLWCPKGWEEAPGQTGSPGASTAFRRTVGRAIPRRVARQQSPLPFHPAPCLYRNDCWQTRASRQAATGPVRLALPEEATHDFLSRAGRGTRRSFASARRRGRSSSGPVADRSGPRARFLITSA